MELIQDKYKATLKLGYNDQSIKIRLSKKKSQQTTRVKPREM